MRSSTDRVSGVFGGDGLGKGGIGLSQKLEVGQARARPQHSSSLNHRHVSGAAHNVLAIPRRKGTLATGAIVRRVLDVSSLKLAAPSRHYHPFRSDTVGAAKPAPTGSVIPAAYISARWHPEQDPAVGRCPDCSCPWRSPSLPVHRVATRSSVVASAPALQHPRPAARHRSRAGGLGSRRSRYSASQLCQRLARAAGNAGPAMTARPGQMHLQASDPGH